MMLALAGTLVLLQQPPHGSMGYVPQRVYDTRQKAFSDFESMLADVARADVIFIGEQHDDGNGHRLELAVLEGLMRRRVPVVLAIEMFERDVQPTLDKYAAGTIDEETFLKDSRPWPRYASDYRPLIEFARAHHFPIVASNAPRRIASDVSKHGLSALDSLGPDWKFVARDLQCAASGPYYDRFAGEMTGHPPDEKAPPSVDAKAGVDRFYLAQCLKDETMAESIAAAFAKASADRATIVHVNGAFHSDFGWGTAERTRRRLPGRRVAVLSILPVDDIDAERPDEDDLGRADYLIYTVK
jgi:uncharacterized iron-regulated protein